MYRRFRQSLFLLFLCAAQLTACKKDKEEVALTKENLAGTYKITASVSNGTDELAKWPECQKDDQLIFKVDETFEVVDAGVQCNTAGTGTYSLPGNNILSLNGAAFTVTKFDGKILSLTYKGASDKTYTDTYTKQ